MLSYTHGKLCTFCPGKQSMTAFVLQAMLAQSNISLEDAWPGVRSQLATLSAFSAVKSELDRQEMYQDYIADLQVSFAKVSCVHMVHITLYVMLVLYSRWQRVSANAVLVIHACRLTTEHDQIQRARVQQSQV